jgi:predicted nucleic acid-binding protein
LSVVPARERPPRATTETPEPAPTYVVDAAVVAKWVFAERDRAAAQNLLAAWTAGAIDLIAPDNLLAELGAIWRRKVRAGDLTADDASALLALLRLVLPRLVPVAELLDTALSIALRHDRPVADALHLALALRDGCPYLVAEDRLFRALAPSFPCVRHLADLSLPGHAPPP